MGDLRPMQPDLLNSAIVSRLIGLGALAVKTYYDGHKDELFVCLLHIRDGNIERKLWPFETFNSPLEVFDTLSGELDERSFDELSGWLRSNFDLGDGVSYSMDDAAKKAEEQLRN